MFDWHDARPIGAGLATIFGAGGLSLSHVESITVIVAAVAGTFATIITLHWRRKEHRRRMQK